MMGLTHQLLKSIKIVMQLCIAVVSKFMSKQKVDRQMNVKGGSP